MKTKHTKGNWDRNMNTHSKKWMQIFVDGNLIAEAKPLHKIGERQNTDFEEEEANAKLIAAAPDLLKGLIEAKTIIYNLCNGLEKRDAIELQTILDTIINKAIK